MKAEHIEVVSFLGKHPPFEDLPEAALVRLAESVEVAYFRRDQDILSFGNPIQDLYVIRSGAVETYRRTGELYSRLSEGDVFGQMGLLRNRRVRFTVKAIEDTLVYCIPVDQFNAYCESFETFADFFDADDSARLRQAVSTRADGNDLTTSPVTELIIRAPLCVSETASVQEVAQLMTQERVSSALVVCGSNPMAAMLGSEVPEESLKGIITDTDLRERVLAEGLSSDVSIGTVVSEELDTLDSKSYVYEAMLTMLRHNVHHIPVVKKGSLLGVISMSDILRHESQSSLLMVRGILAQTDLEGLKAYARHIPAAFVRLVNEDANSHMIGTAMSVIGRTFKQALLAMAEAELGPPPLPYCFLALGSMARDEQLVVTDQDNALILDNRFEPQAHGPYFEKLAQFVSDGLAACGYPYCDGEVMATNPKWRLTLDGWKACFSEWMEKPDPQALLNASIFFDLDGVWGRVEWARQLQRYIAEKAPKEKRFLANLARNALNRTPPLGFFKDFVLEPDGQQQPSINLKRRGTAPLTDLIRVHALAVGSRLQNSFERLDDIESAGILPSGKGQDLRDALEYISMVRIRHQALTLQAEGVPTNNVRPSVMTRFEHRNLKEAFQVVASAQNFLKFAYHANQPLR